MAAVSEVADEIVGAAVVVVPETENQSDGVHLTKSFSKLNPYAKEFVPSAPRKLSAAAPGFAYYNSQDSFKYPVCSGFSDYSTFPDRRRRKRYNSKWQQIRRTIYVTEIPEHLTEAQLETLLTKSCGTVIDCRMSGNMSSPFRYAFIEFSDESEATAAVSLSGMPMPGCPHGTVLRMLPSKTAILPVNRNYLPKSQDEAEMALRTVYCKHVDKKVTETELKKFFEECGEVTRVKFFLEVQRTSCIAFVEFAQLESAELALNRSGTPLGDLVIRVSPSKTPIRTH